MGNPKTKKVLFKDLKVDKKFTYNGDICMCEIQESKHTIFDNITQNKRYKMKNTNVVS